MAVEVRGGEVDVGVIGQQRLLGAEIGHARGQDRAAGGGVAERLEVCAPQRAAARRMTCP